MIICRNPWEVRRICEIPPPQDPLKRRLRQMRWWHFQDSCLFGADVPKIRRFTLLETFHFREKKKGKATVFLLGFLWVFCGINKSEEGQSVQLLRKC